MRQQQKTLIAMSEIYCLLFSLHQCIQQNIRFTKNYLKVVHGQVLKDQRCQNLHSLLDKNAFRWHELIIIMNFYSTISQSQMHQLMVLQIQTVNGSVTPDIIQQYDIPEIQFLMDKHRVQFCTSRTIFADRPISFVQQ